jgi:photosynthetic reaction center H subunit
MGFPAITGYIDAAQLVLYIFWLFFAGLIFYLVRENHREGYPMESTTGARGFPIPNPKTYTLQDGSTVQAPNGKLSPQTLNAVQMRAGGPGAPHEPVGDPLLAGVGPGAWADRADVPDLDYADVPKLAPLRAAPGFGVAMQDVDPRGMTITAADGKAAGTVTDLWVDRSEFMFRYLETSVPLEGGGHRSVLVPVPFCRITKSGIKVHALLAHQFANVPGIQKSDVVTILEEEKISAYFGAGTLYAEPSRREPLV